jgi:hypothetical protein
MPLLLRSLLISRPGALRSILTISSNQKYSLQPDNKIIIVIMRISTTLLIAATVCTNYFAVHAYPSASGSCAAGVGSVQGSHLSSRAITGTLAKGGFSVSLGGVNLVADGTTTFPINTNTPLTLTGTKSFKGFLMRLGSQGGVTTTTALSAGSSMQVLNLCTDAGVGGVTQTSSSSKSTVTATLNMGAASSGMPLDVVVVVSNSGTSEYYHSQFFLTSAAAAVVPVTPAPTIPYSEPAIIVAWGC